jgi:eukaryotic-like serine/threonine-protein kinase
MPSHAQGEKSHLCKLSHNAWRRLEHAVERLETALEAGERPDLAEFLPDDPHLRLAFLIELVHADLEHRLRAGEQARIEDYLPHHPELTEDPRVLLDLIEAEYRLRRDRDPELTVTEYRHRFPDAPTELESRLSGRLAVTVPFADGAVTAPKREGAPAIPGYEILGELGRGGMGVV